MACVVRRAASGVRREVVDSQLGTSGAQRTEEEDRWRAIVVVYLTPVVLGRRHLTGDDSVEDELKVMTEVLER